MLCRALGGALATAVVGANAFLLPPGISTANSPDSVDAFANPTTQAIKLPCPDCVFPGANEKTSAADEGDDLLWAQGGARAVVLNFTLSDDAKAVNINGWQVYPITMNNRDTPTVTEVAATDSLADVQANPEQVTTLEVSGAGIFVNQEVVSEAGDKVVRVNYHVVSVAGQPVSVDAAEVKLFQGADGSLMIISVEGIPELDGPSPPPFSPEGHGKGCSYLPAALCRWKGEIESKLEGFKQGMPPKFGGKGCGGRKDPHKLPGHIRPHLDHFEKPGDGERPEHHHGRPPPPHPHHGMHGMHRGPHHHRPHHFLHRFIRAFVSILVPVIAGITMGMFVSLVGMATGRLIAFLWIKFRRGGQRGYASVAQSDIDNERLEKGDVEVTGEEPLPEYEAAPAYEEREQK